jgi:hypothetical protein
LKEAGARARARVATRDLVPKARDPEVAAEAVAEAAVWEATHELCEVHSQANAEAPVEGTQQGLVMAPAQETPRLLPVKSLSEPVLRTTTSVSGRLP